MAEHRPLLDAYEALFRASKVWKYGSVRGVFDPLGPRLIVSQDFSPFLSSAELAHMTALHDTIREQMATAAWAGIKYANVSPGDKFDPLLHCDIYGVPGNTIETVMWRGIQGHSISYVMCNYDSKNGMIALYEMIMSSNLPDDFKRFLFTDEVQEIMTSPVSMTPADSIARQGGVMWMSHYLGLYRPTRRYLTETCHRLVAAYIAIGGKFPNNPDLERCGVIAHKYGYEQCQEVPYEYNILSVIWVVMKAALSSIGGPLTPHTNQLRGTQICRGFSRILPPADTINDIRVSPCTTVHAPDAVYDVRARIRTPRFLYGMPDDAFNGDVCRGTLVVDGRNFAEMLMHTEKNAHLFTYSVDMSACHMLRRIEIDAIVDTIRQKSPYVMRLVCRLAPTINCIPASLASWKSLVFCDLTLSSGLICGFIGARLPVGENLKFRADSLSAWTGPSIHAPPVDIVRRGIAATKIEVNCIRLISRVSRGSTIDMRTFLQFYDIRGMLTLDDGPIIQALACTLEAGQKLLTLYGDRDEFDSIVPACSAYRPDAACEKCKEVRRLARDGRDDSYREDRCLISCPRACLTPIRPAASAFKYLGGLYDDEPDYAAPHDADDPDECPPMLERAYLSFDQQDLERRRDYDSPREQCSICASRLKECDLKPWMFPLCLSRCEGRSLGMARFCDKCDVCAARSAEANVFCFDICLSNPKWRLMFAREVMTVIRVRGFSFNSIVIVDDTGSGHQFGDVSEAHTLVELLLDIDDTACQCLSEISDSRFCGPSSRIRQIKGDFEGELGAWILAYVMAARETPGLGIQTIAEVAAQCSLLSNESKREEFVHVLNCLDRTGVIRVIGDYVFMSMRQYGTFVKLMRTAVSTTSARGVSSALQNSSFPFGYMEYNKRCIDLLSFLDVRAKDGQSSGNNRAPDLLSMLQMLVISRRAELLNQQADAPSLSSSSS